MVWERWTVLRLILQLFWANWILMPLLGIVLSYRFTASFLNDRAGWWWPRLLIFVLTGLIVIPSLVLIVRTVAVFVDGSTGIAVAYASESLAFGFSMGVFLGATAGILVPLNETTQR